MSPGMQLTMKWCHPLVIVSLSLFSCASLAKADKASCLSAFENEDQMHFVCYCEHQKHVDVSHSLETVFSLANFAYDLPGTVFAKSLYLTFQSCRSLRILLDQKQLTRIGSNTFRPDLSFKEIRLEHVYHVGLARDDDKYHDDSDYLQTSGENVNIVSENVALLVVERGALFEKLLTKSNGTILYIDLNGARGDEEVTVEGFDIDHIYFVTNNHQQIPLQQGEDLEVKMRQLTEEMQGKSHVLSLALSMSTVIVLMGIFGLIIVANHRQKRKRQLKAILRAKNLGPVLESKKIAREVSDNFFSKSRLAAPFQKSPLKVSRFGSQLPMTTGDIESPNKMSKFKMHRLDFNEFLSSIMYRMRKADFTVEQPPGLEKMVTKSKIKQKTPKPKVETSFYYKESSITPSSDSNSKSSIKLSKPPPQRARHGTPSLKSEATSSKTSDVSSASSSTSASETSSASATSSSSSESSKSSESGSYVSKLSHYVTYTSPIVDSSKRPKEVIPPPLPEKPSVVKSMQKALKKTHPPALPKAPASFQEELKEKSMTFFTSVTKTKKEGAGDLLDHNNTLYDSKTKL